MLKLIAIVYIIMSPAFSQSQGAVCEQRQILPQGIDIDNLLISKIKKFGGVRCNGDDYVDYGHEREKDRRACVKRRDTLWGKPICSGNITRTYPAWCVKSDGSTYNHQLLIVRDRDIGVGCAFENCKRYTDKFYLKK